VQKREAAFCGRELHGTDPDIHQDPIYGIKAGLAYEGGDVRKVTANQRYPSAKAGERILRQRQCLIISVYT
jgi:hypothetical protein